METEAVLNNIQELHSGEIAALIAAEGIRGEKNDPYCCPLARYLGGSVGRSWIAVGCDYIWDYETFTEYPMAPHIAEFITRFDAGDFPELEE